MNRGGHAGDGIDAEVRLRKPSSHDCRGAPQPNKADWAVGDNGIPVTFAFCTNSQK